MDRPGEAAEKAAGQVWTGAHCVLRSRVLCSQCHPTAARDHKVMFDGWPKPELQTCLEETFNILRWNYFLVWIILINPSLELAFVRLKLKWWYIVYNRSNACCQCCFLVLSSVTSLCKKRNVTPLSLSAARLSVLQISVLSPAEKGCSGGEDLMLPRTSYSLSWPGSARYTELVVWFGVYGRGCAVIHGCARVKAGGNTIYLNLK